MPRFTGNAIHNVKIAVTQLCLADAGLALLAIRFAERAQGERASIPDELFLPGVPSVLVELSRALDGNVSALDLIIGRQRLHATRK